MADILSVNSANDINTQYRYSTTKNTSDKSNMSMQDFLSLVVAQMQNQDINNTQDNGQFMAQMAQMASMQAMQELTAAFMSSMTMSYMGKYVKAQAVTDDGSKVSTEGVVERVNFNGGDAFVLVGNTWFKTQDVYEVSTPVGADAANAGTAGGTNLTDGSDNAALT